MCEPTFAHLMICTSKPLLYLLSDTLQLKSHHLLVPLLFVFYGCTKDVQQSVLVKPPGCDSGSFSYANDIRPVILANCTGPVCHSGGNPNYDFRTYAVIADRVRTGRFEERLLLPENDPMHMPAGREIGECDLFTLRTWIHQGYNNN